MLKRLNEIICIKHLVLWLVQTKHLILTQFYYYYFLYFSCFISPSHCFIIFHCLFFWSVLNSILQHCLFVSTTGQLCAGIWQLGLCGTFFNLFPLAYVHLEVRMLFLKCKYDHVILWMRVQGRPQYGSFHHQILSLSIKLFVKINHINVFAPSKHQTFCFF